MPVHFTLGQFYIGIMVKVSFFIIFLHCRHWSIRFRLPGLDRAAMYPGLIQNVALKPKFVSDRPERSLRLSFYGTTFASDPPNPNHTRYTVAQLWIGYPNHNPNPNVSQTVTSAWYFSMTATWPIT